MFTHELDVVCCMYKNLYNPNCLLDLNVWAVIVFILILAETVVRERSVSGQRRARVLSHGCSLHQCAWNAVIENIAFRKAIFLYPRKMVKET